MHLTYRQSCRVCGSKHLKPVIDIGEQFLQGSFFKPQTPQPPLRKLPLRLVRCDVTCDEAACGLLQMAHSVPPAILYSNYWYRSGTNMTMQQHLKAIVDLCVALRPEEQLTVLDIGCNDGTLLYCYPSHFHRFGVDPSDIAQGIEAPITVVGTTFPSQLALQSFGNRKFDVITAIAMFYDLEDPVAFAAAVARVLAPNGIWVIETSYLPLMLEKNSFDTICHEHLEYYSLAVLEYIMVRAGLRVFRHELSEINGGSIRCYITHADNFAFDTAKDSAQLASARVAEFELALDTDRPYVAFQSRIEAIREKLIGLLRNLRASGKTIHIYGASTKGNTLLQWCGIDRSIVECAADRNPEKHGALTLGTNIPIISEQQSRDARPDYYLVLPWHFKAEFLERERNIIKSGTTMIFPLPELTLIGAEDIEAHATAAA